MVFGVQWEEMAGCFNLLGAVYVCVDPFLLLPWIGMQSVIVVFSAHTQILSLTIVTFQTTSFPTYLKYDI